MNESITQYKCSICNQLLAPNEGGAINGVWFCDDHLKNQNNLSDIQKTEPKYNYPIQTVGIKDLKFPIYISEKNGGKQHTVADIEVYVSLDGDTKGTHMSRLAIGVQKFSEYQLHKDLMINIAEYIKNKCESRRCQIIYKFPYFISKIAPVSKEPGMIHCDVVFDLISEVDEYLFTVTVTTTTTSLCPCSKEISNNGAHNQRSKVKLSGSVSNGFVLWIEDLVKIAEDCSSCEIYSVLKRPDEKYVTEKAYENPNFVEDMVRSIYDKMIKLPLVDFDIQVANEESIHTHQAFARMKRNKEDVVNYK